jgi:hypothetical protein
MNTSKTASKKVNAGNGASQDQRHVERKRSDTDTTHNERLDQQDAPEPRRVSRETAERIPADPDPDDPASP